MRDQDQRHDFVVQDEKLLFYDPIQRTYAYRVRSNIASGNLGIRRSS